MKTSISYPLAFVGIALACGVVGCTTTGNERAAETRTTMQTVENDINQLSAQLDATGSSLNALLSPGQTNIQTAFKTYSDNVDQMQNLGSAFLKHADAMGAQGTDYFSEWSKQGATYTNPEIRTVSEERRAELSAAFARISQTSVGVRGALQVYLTDIRDLRTFLSTDLTPKGLQAVESTAAKTVKDGQALKESIQPVLAAVASARGKLAPGGIPTAP